MDGARTAAAGRQPIAPRPVLRVFLKSAVLFPLVALVLAMPCSVLNAQESGPAVLPVVRPMMECTQLTRSDLSGAAGVTMRITAAAVTQEGSAEFCQVKGYVSPRVEFEVRLPTTKWTQRYVQTGCGALCGGTRIRVNNAENCAPANNGELALASTNTGHETAGTDGAWAADDLQLRVDFGYRSVHVTALAAKALIEKYYGQKARYSYFTGCSEGGREAMVEAQRYPEDFNGISAGAPAHNFITQNTFYHAWNARMNSDADGRAILTAGKLPLLHAAVMEACDALDGLKDGLLTEPTGCHYDPVALQCKSGQDSSTCLTPAQVNMVREVYRGAHDEKGRQLVICGPLPGSELQWRGIFVPAQPDQMASTTSASLSTSVIKYMAYPKNPPHKFTLADFRFDEGTFKAMQFAHEIYDALNPDLSKFAAAGSKLIMWHGSADAAISPVSTIGYYNAVETLMGADRTKQFARLYLLPGGGHCTGGDEPISVDMLSPLMAWVERGIAPNRLLSTQTRGAGSAPSVGAPADPAKVIRIRPVFPYPQTPQFKGSGSIDDPANFVAGMPKTLEPAKYDWMGGSFFSAGYEKWCGWSGVNFVCSSERK